MMAFPSEREVGVDELLTLARSRLRDEPLAALKAADKALSIGEGGKSFAEANCVKAWALKNLGRYRPALAAFSKALGLSRRWNLSTTKSECLNGIGQCLYRLGDYEGAFEYLNEFLSIGRSNADDASIAVALVNLGNAHVEMDAPAEALSSYLLALEHLPVGSPNRATILHNVGSARALLGNHALALAAFESAITELGEVDQEPRLLASLYCNIGHSLGCSGRPVEARMKLDAALVLAREHQLMRQEAQTLCELGKLTFDQGAGQDALYFVELGLVVAESSGASRLVAKLSELAQAIYTALGRFEEALDAATHTFEIEKKLLASKSAQRTRAELLRSTLPKVDVSPSKGPAPPLVAPGPAAPSLSDREEEILGFIAQGESNKEIAKRLNLSPYTVRHHVSRLLAKLKATSRAQAVALGMPRGVSSPSP